MRDHTKLPIVLVEEKSHGHTNIYPTFKTLRTFMAYLIFCHYPELYTDLRRISSIRLTVPSTHFANPITRINQCKWAHIIHLFINHRWLVQRQKNSLACLQCDVTRRVHQIRTECLNGTQTMCGTQWLKNRNRDYIYCCRFLSRVIHFTE